MLKYAYLCRIYLVGFPEALEAQDSPPISGMIKNLVPEAHVRIHRIFNKMVLDHSVSDVDLEDHVGVDGTEISILQADEEEHQSQLNLPQTATESQLAENEPSDGNSDRNAGTAVEDKMKSPLSVYDIGGKEAAGVATSVTSIAGHDFFFFALDTE